MQLLIDQQRVLVTLRDRSVTAFFVGTNACLGTALSIIHYHMHLIPRCKGDV